MLESTPRVSLKQEGAATVVELIDRKILDEVAIMEIGDQLAALVGQTDQPRLVLDFVNVGHMSSSALGMLVTVRKQVKDKSGMLRLCNIQPTIQEIFTITRLGEIFEIKSSRDEALDGLS
jgi:anti-sigma B factor antagonist